MRPEQYGIVAFIMAFTNFVVLIIRLLLVADHSIQMAALLALMLINLLFGALLLIVVISELSKKQ